jgi:hypothetical protein
MANKLFQQAREFVKEALHADHDEHQENQVHQKQDTEEIAKNALSSAFANSTVAEKEQLSELQKELEGKL